MLIAHYNWDIDSFNFISAYLTVIFLGPCTCAISDVHGPASGRELGRAELFWAGLSWALEAAHQGLRPGSGKVKAGAGGSGHG